jgi:SAM-dependent methyltransferase
VLALPSRSDCFELVQAEAMLCGTPVVASDIPGAREAVRRTGMGRLVAAEDPAALAAGLHAVLRDRRRYERPRTEIAAAFDCERVLEAYEALLQSLCAGRAAPRRPAELVPVSVRMHPSNSSFAPSERAILARVLGNEMDMANRRRLPLLLEYLDLRDGDRVLDGGCGMGFGLLAMGALRSLSLTGLDRDLARLQVGRREDVPGTMVQAAVERLPFAAGSFDKILLAEVLEHVDDDRAALRELYRVLRPGGRLAISVPHANFPLLWDPINRLWAQIGGRPLRRGPLVGIWSLHRRLYWPDDLSRRVAEAGFVVEQVEATTHYSVPFAHFLVYGIGKPFIERDLLPARWRASADRMRGAANPGGRFNPINLARAVLAYIDRFNERPSVAQKRTFVNVLLKARKP